MICMKGQPKENFSIKANLKSAVKTSISFFVNVILSLLSFEVTGVLFGIDNKQLVSFPELSSSWYFNLAPRILRSFSYMFNHYKAKSINLNIFARRPLILISSVWRLDTACPPTTAVPNITSQSNFASTKPCCSPSFPSFHHHR